MAQHMESSIEAWARMQVRQMGGRMLKWVSPGAIGVPDDIIFWPNGQIHFVEFKAPGEALRRAQVHMHNDLSALGAKVFTLRGMVETRAYIAQQQVLQEVE